MKYIVIDLEMSRIAKEYKVERQLCGMEVIEIGAVMLDDAYQEIDSFVTFVKPQFNNVVSNYYSQLTGITTEKVADAPVFEEALNQFFEWYSRVDDQVDIYQWSTSDIEQFAKEIELKEIVLDKKNQKIMSDWSDLQKEYSDKLNLPNAISLKKAMLYAGVDGVGKEHDALDDARNTATLLKIMRTPELYKMALERVVEVLTPKSIGNTLGSMIDFTTLGISA